MARLFDAWLDPVQRRAWMGPGATVRTKSPPKSMRLGLGDGSIVVVGFMAKGRDKSIVAVEHAKLADRETAERVKAEWSEKFDALAETLRAPSSV